jgi:hypothetical protein
MDATQAAALLTALQDMQAKVLALENAARLVPPPAPPIDPMAIAVAAANAVAAVPRQRDHSKDLDKSPNWDGEKTSEGTPLRADDFNDNIDATFGRKATPEADKVPLVIDKLRGRALATFKGFLNAAGHTGNRTTTTWDELKALLLTLLPDIEVERDELEREYEHLRQAGPAVKYVDAYKSVVARIALNRKARALHTPESFIIRFVTKLKPQVQVHLAGREFKTLEEAYSAAIHQDKLVFAASSSPAWSPRTPRTPTPSRAGTPAPPPHFAALLAALTAMVNPAAQTPSGASPNGPSASPLPPQGLGAVEKDHSVAPGDPVPRLTPEIKQWCYKNRACFRCRVRNANHLGIDCPRYKGVPDRRIAFVEECDQEKEGN